MNEQPSLQLDPIPDTAPKWTDHVGVQYVDLSVKSLAPLCENDPDMDATATVPFAGPPDNSALGLIDPLRVFTGFLRYVEANDTCELYYDETLPGAGLLKDGTEWGLSPFLEAGSGFVDINGALTANVNYHASGGDTLTALKKGKTATAFPSGELVTICEEPRGILGIKWVTSEFIAYHRYDYLYHEQEAYPTV
jgi:hypothetical protein